MSAAEKILVAEETVAGLQGQLGTAETVLETAENVAAAVDSGGRCLRRFFRVLLFLSAVTVVLVVFKKVMGERCSMGEEPTPASESISDTVEPDAGDEGAS